MFHTYSEEPAQNILADEIFWIVTFIFLKCSLPTTPRGGLCFYLSLQCHLHGDFCVNCLSQALTNFLSVCIAYKVLGTHSASPMRGDPAPCPVASSPSNENRQAQHIGNHTNTRPRKMLLAWELEKASWGLEELEKETEVFGGRLGEGCVHCGTHTWHTQ